MSINRDEQAMTSAADVAAPMVSRGPAVRRRVLVAVGIAAGVSLSAFAGAGIASAATGGEVGTQWGTDTVWVPDAHSGTDQGFVEDHGQGYVEDYAAVVVVPVDPSAQVPVDDVVPDAGVPVEECFGEAPIA